MSPASCRLRSGRWCVLARVLVLAAILPACLDTHSWKEKEKPWVPDTVAGEQRVQIEDSGGRRFTLDHPRIGRDEQGEFLSGRASDPGGKELRIDLADVRALEVREVDVGSTAASIGAGIVVLAAFVLYLLYG